MTEAWRGRTTGAPGGNWSVTDIRGDGTRPPGYLERAARQPDTEARGQRRRQVARFGKAVVNEMEAKVDAMAVTPGALGRENVLSLMEGMYSRSGDALARELLRLIRKLAAEPGNRILVMERAAGIERELDADGR